MYNIPYDNSPYVVNNEFTKPSANRALIMRGEGYKEMRILLDVSDGRKNLKLNFSYLTDKFTSDSGNHAGVYLSNPMIPTSERRLFDFAVGDHDWTEKTLNLGAIIELNQAMFGDDYLEIIFRGSNHSEATLVLDDIRVTENYQVASLPYINAFEVPIPENGIDDYWTATFSGDGGKLGIVAHDEAYGQKALALQNVEEETESLRAHLHLNLADEDIEDEIMLECNLVGMSTEVLKRTRILLRDASQPDQAPIEVKNYENTTLRNAFVKLNLKQEVQNHGLELSNDFEIIFEAMLEKAFPEEGLLIDNVKVFTKGTIIPAELPYATDFTNFSEESDHWDLATNTGKTEVRSLTESRFNQKALILEGGVDGCNYNAPYSTNSADLHLNLSGRSGVKLQFHYYNFRNDGADPEVGGKSGVYISERGGFSLKKIYDFPPQSHLRDWKRVELDLDSAIQVHKLKYTEDFAVVFIGYSRYNINYDSGCQDGFAIDRVLAYADEQVNSVAASSTNREYDAHENDYYFPKFDYNHLYHIIGHPKGNYRSGILWELDVPKGATIVEAYIQFSSHSATYDNGYTYGYFDINMEYLSFKYFINNYSDNPKVNARSTLGSNYAVEWAIRADSWSVNKRSLDTRTPDLTAIVHKAVNYSTWKPNKLISFLIKPKYPNQQVTFRFYSHESSVEYGNKHQPVLHVKYLTEDGQLCSTVARISTAKAENTNTAFVENVSEEGAQDEFSVFPNPVIDQLSITLPKQAEKQTITLLNMQGQVLHILEVAAGQTSADMSMGNLPAGLYMIHSSHENKAYRIMKQ